MGIFSFITSLFQPATNLIDDLHTSEEEKVKLRIELAKIQDKANEKIIELERSRLTALSTVQKAEANSKFFLTASWRPICSMVIVSLILLDSFEVVKAGPQLYELAKIFLGAYAGSRSIEKIVQVSKLGK